MADVKISGLPASTVPLAGTEVLPIVQSGSTKKVAVSDLTAGRSVSMSALTATTTALVGNVAQQGILDVGISGAVSNQFLTGGAGNNLVTGVFKIGSGSSRGASVQGFRGASSNVHSLDLYSYNSADVHVMRMESNGDAKVTTGNLVMGTAAKGIDFSINPNPAGATSELLNDYEEGTWTPVYLATTGTLGAITYENRTGTYTKVGNLVTVTGGFFCSAFAAGTGSGSLLISGLPFTCAAVNGQTGAVGDSRLFLANNPSGMQIVASSVNVFFYYRTTANGAVNFLQVSDAATGSGALNLVYFTASYRV